MQSIIDLIQAIARQRGRGDASPLIMLRQLDGAPGQRISHLPVEGELVQAWVALTGEPFRPHQAQALATLRRGEPIALCAASPAIMMTGYLLLYAALVADAAGTALILVHDDETAQSTRAVLDRINANLPQNLRATITLVEPDVRPNPYARIVIATPNTLHYRLLRHHDRAWRLMWSQLRLVVLPDLHNHAGIAGTHIADLLLRLQRITAYHNNGQLPNLLATTIALSDPQPALTNLLGQPWRIISSDDIPYDASTLAVWHSTTDRLREASEVARAIQQQGYQVHIVCQPLETHALAPMIEGAERISFGSNIQQAHVLIVAGYAGSPRMIQRMLRSGCQAVVVVLGELPYEQMVIRHPATLLQETPLNWPEPPINAYVTAQHLLCAATELPLFEAEVEAWGAQDIVNRLVAHKQLVDLPDPEVAWKPTSEAGDPYAEFSTLSSSGGAIIARSEQGREIDLIDPTGFERWTFPGAALPPGAGGLRVTERIEEMGSVTLRLESNGRRTYPLRRCEVTLRDEHGTRVLFGAKHIGLARVVIEEEVYGYREATSSGVPTEVALNSALRARWIAPACWIDLSTDVQVQGQFIGWSLSAALPLRTLSAFTDSVPCYDQKIRRVYFVDAQPGGNGLAAWIYNHAEELLPLAYDIALACRNDVLLEPLSRVDMDWLLTLLGQRTNVSATEPVEAATTAPRAQKAGVSRQLAEEPSPTPPPLLLTPELPEIDLPPLGRGDPISSPPKRSAPEDIHQERLPERPPSTPDRYVPSQHDESSSELHEHRKPYNSIKPPTNMGQANSTDKTHINADSTDKTHTNGERPRKSPVPPRKSPTSPTKRTKPPDGRPQSDRSVPPNPNGPSTNEGPPDADALIARLRQRRKQQEAQAAHHRPQQTSHGSSNVEPRFAAGERVFCLPYGDGVVQESRIEDGREVLSVTFPTYGDLTIDPAVSLVRKIEDPPEEQDDLL